MTLGFAASPLMPIDKLTDRRLAGRRARASCLEKPGPSFRGSPQLAAAEESADLNFSCGDAIAVLAAKDSASRR